MNNYQRRWIRKFIWWPKTLLVANDEGRYDLEKRETKFLCWATIEQSRWDEGRWRSIAWAPDEFIRKELRVNEL